MIKTFFIIEQTCHMSAVHAVKAAFNIARYYEHKGFEFLAPP